MSAKHPETCKRKSSSPGGAPEVVRQITSLAALVTVTLAARASLADHYVVPSGSMEPTVEVGDHVVVDKLAYGVRVPFTEQWLLELSPPRAGDVVVLSSPEDGIVLLKRVVATPGDTVAVRGGRLVVNGITAPLRKEGERRIETLGGREHLTSFSYGGGPDLETVRVPDDAFLVMGDNRGNSHDGRTFGFVSRRAILGRAVAAYLRHGSLTWARF